MAGKKPVYNVRWAKPSPANPSISSASGPIPLAFACTFSTNSKVCNKVFARQCDLSRHEKSHTRSSICKVCDRGFATAKDLDRHINTKHEVTRRYFCPYSECAEAMGELVDGEIVQVGSVAESKIEGMEGGEVRGFKRKDHWQKHLVDEHRLRSEAIKVLGRRAGMPPMAVLKDGLWLVVLPDCVASGSRIRHEGSGVGDADMDKNGDDQQEESEAEANEHETEDEGDMTGKVIQAGLGQSNRG